MDKNKTVWAFDLGKGSIGEAVRRISDNKFLHKESLLIPEKFADTKPAAGRRRMWRTRIAHSEREKWLDDVMRKAGIEPLQGRQVGKVDTDGNIIPQSDWKKIKSKWIEIEPKTSEQKLSRERLEREFSEVGDNTCYTSCLLRIKLLNWKKGDPELAPWQIYKALHSAIQKRGYGKVPWAAKEAARQGMTPEDLEKKQRADLEKKDPSYKAVVEAWPTFKRKVGNARFHFPCYYDAEKMGLWSLANPDALGERTSHQASSTRKIRFDQVDVQREIICLGNNAAAQLDKLRTAFDKLQQDGWLVTDEVSGNNPKTGLKYQGLRVRRLKVLAKTFGEFLCYGPGGKMFAGCDAVTVKALEIEVLEHPNPPQNKKRMSRGSKLDWLGGAGQKIPRFDNRIIEKCALIPRLNVCRAGAKPGFNDDPLPDPESLLHSEVAFLLKLKNVGILRAGTPDALTAKQIQQLFDRKKDEISRLRLKRDDPKYAEKVAEVFAFGKKEWAKVGSEPDFGFRPYINQETIEAPKNGGRSRFSRPALKIIRELILGNQAPSAFHKRLLNREPELLLKLGTKVQEKDSFVIRPFAIFKNSPDKKINAANSVKGLLESELGFLEKMRKAGAGEDSWKGIFIPNEKLDGLVLRIQGEKDASRQRQKRDEAIYELIGSQNDPIVRHRLKYFWGRLQTLEKSHGEPQRIILEFAREDFLGKKAKKRWQDFNKAKRELNDKAAKDADGERDQLKIKLWQEQGGECVYGRVLPNGEMQRGLPSYKDPEWDQLEIDHIVPRGSGGPNAYVNYVLTWGELANQQKRDRIPYVWFSQDRTEKLSGYINFVQSKKSTKEKPGLSGKKIALLTRPDAAELVESYTALAQTAWIARLAQTIIRLHFGWPLDHQKGEERVLTLTGGQTAQFRRAFRLNSLLGENAKINTSIGDISKKEEDDIAAQIQDDLMKENTKNRVDPRHHALDAMVLALIPEWRHYEAKKWAKWRGQYLDEKRRKEILERPTPFFDSHTEQKNGKEFLNKNSVRQQFAAMLHEIHAELVIFQQPQMEEMHYDKTTQQIEKAVSKPLDEIAFLSANDSAQRKFDKEKLVRWLKRCTDEKQKEAINEFLEQTPSFDAWEQFKKSNKKLFPGAKVRVTAPQATVQYTIRKELRLLAYENNSSKTEKIFKPEWVREDVEQIDTTTPVMRSLKSAIDEYLKSNPEPEGSKFLEWLKASCKKLGVSKIRLSSLADEFEEADSRRKGQSKPPENFGCRNLSLVFKRERLLKIYGKICDPIIRSAIASEFKIEGEGKKAKCRSFTRDEWETFCQNFRKPTKQGISGPSVLKVTLTAGDSDEENEETETFSIGEKSIPPTETADEFVESTKSPGAFLKGKSHKGYYLYLDRNEDWQRLPVFAHQSYKEGHERFEAIKKREQCAPNSKFREIGFLQTGCRVKLESDAKTDDKVIAPAGIYRMNTLQQNGRMKLTAQNGSVTGGKIQLFIAAGLHRIV